MSPAGMEPLGSEGHRRSPAGVSVRGNANQSNLRTELPLSWPTLGHAVLCPRRESNPHLRFRKPLFYPLNYGNNLERINGLNGDEQDTRAARSAFFEGDLCARLSAAYLKVSLRRAFPCESKWPPKLRKRSNSKSRMSSFSTLSLTPSSRLTSSTPKLRN